MYVPLRVLILEDRPTDTASVLRELHQAGFDPVWQRVETESDYLAHLDPALDVILAEYNLPRLGAPRALQLLQERELDIPFIAIAGRDSEEVVVECMKQGAADYLFKDRLARLGQVVEHALQERKMRQGNKQSQEALKASQDYARSIIESSLDMIIAVDQNRKIIEFNRAAEETLGYRREEVLGKSIDIVYADPPAGETINRTTIEKGRSAQEIWNRRKNGEIFPSLLSASILTDAHGKPIGVMGISRDITARKRAEQELQRRADEFSALYETTRDLAMQHDLPTLLQTIVERASTLLHAPGGGIYLYDRERSDLHFEAKKGAHNPPTGSRLALGEGMAGRVAQTRQPMIVDDYRASECRSPKYEGLPITAVVEIPMLYGGELIGILVVNEFDTTTRTFTEANIRLLELFASHAASAVHNATLFDQVRAGRERMQTLSHSLIQAQENERRSIARELHDEIGQALTGVQLNSQALESLLPDASARALLQDNMATIEHALHQVRDLSLNLRPSILDDFGLVAALKWLVNRQAPRAGLTIELTADPLKTRPPSDIETVCFRVAQEALTNVIQHAHASHVLIELKQRGTELHLVIRDNGMGFDVPTALKRAAGGASLGLLGMHERVNLVRGRIGIESTQGQGTLIQAHFPLSSPPSFVERRTRRRDPR
jgi:PAS domain S-box-containing protein